ncbi:MAG: hypothetical protein KBF75_08520 [Saprospiraceae bacterium]|jgi:hypothetical protein|nr:hypothetical protein [Saprospiraceae bacterium]
MKLLFNIPDNLKDAIRLFESHINQLKFAYFSLINDYKNDSSQNEIPFYENFEQSLKQAFDVKYSITSSVFISFIEDYFLENDLESLQKAYNIISNKLNNLLEFRKLRFNPKYYHTNSMYDNAPKGLFLFIDSLGFELDENGNYKQPLPDFSTADKFFTADNFFDKIKNEIITTLIKIHEIFRLRKLNNIETQTTTQPTPPQKELKPIKWQKQSTLLAYLINELKTYGFIDESNIWAICEQVFVDKKGNPIKAQTFTSMVKNYENNQTPDGRKGKPKAHTEITELVELLKILSKEIG